MIGGRFSFSWRDLRVACICCDDACFAEDGGEFFFCLCIIYLCADGFVPCVVGKLGGAHGGIDARHGICGEGDDGFVAAWEVDFVLRQAFACYEERCVGGHEVGDVVRGAVVAVAVNVAHSVAAGGECFFGCGRMVWAVR